MSKRVGGIVFGILAFSFILAQCVYADTVLFSDNFDSESLALTYSGFAQWAVSSGSVDLIGSPSFYDLHPGNGRYVDMSGSTGQAGSLSSLAAFTFVPGNVYTFSFDLGGSMRPDGNNAVTAQLGSLYSNTYTLGSAAALSTYAYSFSVPSAVSNVNILFSHETVTGKDNMGIILDNVKLSSVPVPEPISSTLFLLGAGAFVLRRRRASK